MQNRRQFLKEAATGAALIGTGSTLGMSALMAEPAKSKVVVARDPLLHGSNGQPDVKRVFDLLDRAITTYTGNSNPLAAWRSLVPVDQVIGLKVNGLGGKGISTHAVLANAIAFRLQQAGAKPGNIVIWDRNAGDLEACGLEINESDPTRVRCFGSDHAGYEDEKESWGAASQRLSRILARECAMVINVPILKDHSMAGVTFAMKNMYGVVKYPFFLHGNNCAAVADLNCFPTIRSKVRLTIGDAFSSVYDGGPGFHPEHLWYPNALIVGEDRVAVDSIAWQMIERKRSEAGFPSLEAAKRAPHYIAAAADSSHQLGTNDPQRIHQVDV
jgi:uncharacterized protein (DUF362 family)